MRYCLSFFMLVLIYSCSSSEHSRSGVEQAMKTYDRLILRSDADSISLLYTPDGKLGEMATGRDSIRNFLSSFKNIKVLSQESVTESISLNIDTAIQKGTYAQSDLMAGKDTVHVKGKFIATWQWMKDKGWLIKKMMTTPIK